MGNINSKDQRLHNVKLPKFMTNPEKCMRIKSFRVEMYDGFNLNLMSF